MKGRKPSHVHVWALELSCETPAAEENRQDRSDTQPLDSSTGRWSAGDVGDGRPAVCHQKVMFEEPRGTLDHSLLGQLGRHSSDDPPTPSRSRRPHGPVTLERSWRMIPFGGSRGVVAAGIDAP